LPLDSKCCSNYQMKNLSENCEPTAPAAGIFEVLG